MSFIVCTFLGLSMHYVFNLFANIFLSLLIILALGAEAFWGLGRGHFSRLPAFRTCLIPSDMDLTSPFASIMKLLRRRPAWRSPMFSTGIPRSGASIIPLEELPAMASNSCRAARYRFCPRDGTAQFVSGCCCT